MSNKITSSFAAIDKNLLIKACENCLKDDKEWRDEAREKFVKELQKPRRVWKFWPFYSKAETMTPQQAEERTEYLESISDNPFHHDYSFLIWKTRFGWPNKVMPLLSLAKNTLDDIIYLSSDDINVIMEWGDNKENK